MVVWNCCSPILELFTLYRLYTIIVISVNTLINDINHWINKQIHSYHVTSQQCIKEMRCSALYSYTIYTMYKFPISGLHPLNVQCVRIVHVKQMGLMSLMPKSCVTNNNNLNHYLDYVHSKQLHNKIQAWFNLCKSSVPHLSFPLVRWARSKK